MLRKSFYMESKKAVRENVSTGSSAADRRGFKYVQFSEALTGGPFTLPQERSRLKWTVLRDKGQLKASNIPYIIRQGRLLFETSTFESTIKNMT